MITERDYYLGFSVFSGIGALRFRRLLDVFGTAENAWFAGHNRLVSAGLSKKLSEKFIHFRKKFSLKDFKKKLKKSSINFLAFIDKDYPELVRQISDPPIVIYFRGQLKNAYNFQNALAVVGSRKASAYGRQVVAKLVSDLIDEGYLIVSGMAYGIDTCAHEQAVKMGGKTIAVLGSGIDVIYPKSNSLLYHKIIKDSGLVVSEFPPGTLTSRGLFPSRNRIISGLSLGVLVVEGAEKSGSLITARLAAEQGREVFAIPGAITFPGSKAPSILIKQGAKMVTSIDDILEELPIVRRKSYEKGAKGFSANNNKKFTTDEYKIIKILETEAQFFEEILKKSKFDPKKLNTILSFLEVKSCIQKTENGKYYTTKKS